MQYVKAFSSQVLSTVKSNPQAILDLYRVSSDYTWTNLGVDEVSYLASLVVSKDITEFEVKMLLGEMRSGEKYAEFYLDSEDVQHTVIETFYSEVG